MEPTEWTVVEPDEPRPDWAPPATPPDVRDKLAAREAGPGRVPPSTPPAAATACPHVHGIVSADRSPCIRMPVGISVAKAHTSS